MRTTTILPSMAACAQAGARMHEGLPLGGRRADSGKEPRACDLWPGGKGIRAGVG